MEPYVITIARGFGSGGKEIATKLARRLGIPCFERQLITMASRISGIDESLFVATDEKLRGSYLVNALKKVPYTYQVEPTERDFVSDANLFRIVAQVIREVAKVQSCVIIGKCADYLLKDYPNVVSVYIEAPRKDCLASVMEKMLVSEEEAARMIRKTDKYRAQYYKYYTGGGLWTNPINYDMTLNSARVGRDRCVDLIEACLKMKTGGSYGDNTAAPV